jgi:DNA-directed RNA polymerase alpha subunit
MSHITHHQAKQLLFQHAATVVMLDEKVGLENSNMPASWRKPILEVPMSVRLFNCLSKIPNSFLRSYDDPDPQLIKIKTLADLRKLDDQTFLKIRGAGEKSLEELKQILSEHECIFHDNWCDIETATQTLKSMGVDTRAVKEEKRRTAIATEFVDNITTEMLQSENVTMKLPVDINDKASDIFEQLRKNGFNVEYAATVTRNNPDVTTP